MLTVMTKANRVQYAIKLVVFITILIFHPSNSLSKINKLSVDSTLNRLTSSEVIYTNPRVYNVDYSFELVSGDWEDYDNALIWNFE